MISTLQVDDLEFEVRWSGQRRTLGLTVDREGDLVISAPIGCDPALLTSFVREKRFWLYTKMAEKEALRDEVRPREFVGGEGFPYLGRNHRLRLVDDQDAPLKLERGRFLLRRSQAADGRRLFINWYTDRGMKWLGRRLNRFVPHIGATPSRIDVRELGFRWGSCGRNGNVSFHWTTILLPPAVIDYVIVHELVHLVEQHHTPEFWRTLERVMPDYAARKARLAGLGALHAGILRS